jgi:hypothetical protein
LSFDTSENPKSKTKMQGQHVADTLSEGFQMTPKESSVFLVTFEKNDQDFGSGVDGEQKYLVYVFHQDNGMFHQASSAFSSLYISYDS